MALTMAGLCTACVGHPVQPVADPEPADHAPYHVQIGDQLSIRLFLTPELNEDVTVRPDGRITTQIAEAVPAAGLTPEQLAVSLRANYAAELKDPRLTVEVKAAAPLRIYVAGEVAAPGEVTTEGPPLTLLQAVSRAGGLRVTGDPEHVLVIRRNNENRPTVLTARYAAAFSGNDPSADMVLQAFDIVVVPRTGMAEIYVWVNQHIQQFVPVNWGFSYNVSPLVNSNKP
jgi:polysaccharide export outer membrane protein